MGIEDHNLIIIDNDKTRSEANVREETD